MELYTKRILINKPKEIPKSKTKLKKNFKNKN